MRMLRFSCLLMVLLLLCACSGASVEIPDKTFMPDEAFSFDMSVEAFRNAYPDAEKIAYSGVQDSDPTPDSFSRKGKLFGRDCTIDYTFAEDGSQISTVSYIVDSDTDSQYILDCYHELQDKLTEMLGKPYFSRVSPSTDASERDASKVFGEEEIFLDDNWIDQQSMIFLHCGSFNQRDTDDKITEQNYMVQLSFTAHNEDSKLIQSVVDLRKQTAAPAQ